MQTLIHADVFFFITTIAVVVLAAAFLVASIYLIVILRDIRELSRIIRKEGEEIAEDVNRLRQEMRQEIRAGSSSAVALFGFFRNLFMRRKADGKKRAPHSS
jgi:hypothetical protein